MADQDSKPYGIVYCIEHRASGKVYIGQTVGRLSSRWAAHQREDYCAVLHRAIKKYGADAFTVSVVDTATSKEDLNVREAFWIDMLLARNRDYGYNLRAGGSFGKHSPESRAKMSEKVRAANQNPAVRAKRGKHQIGQKYSPERCAKISAALTGKTATEEARIKMAERKRALWADPEMREKIRLAQIDGKRTSEARSAAAEKARAQWADPEKRARVLAAQAEGKARARARKAAA